MIRSLASSRAFSSSSVASTLSKLVPIDPPINQVPLLSDPVRSLFAYTQESFASPPTPDNATLIFVHGGPGSHRDFRYMSAAIQELYTSHPSPSSFPISSVVRVDLAGYGGSSPLPSSTPDPSPSNLSAALLSGLRSASLLPPNHKCVLVSHSLGSHVAASAAHSSPPSCFAGVAMLAPVCLSPHRGLGGERLYPVSRWAGMNCSPETLGGSIVRKVLEIFYKRFAKFPDRTTIDEICYTQNRVARLSFPLMNDIVRDLAARNFPSFLAYGEDDHLIEKHIFEQLGVALKTNPTFILNFKDGGHNLQKKKAREISKGLVEWVATLPPASGHNTVK